MGRGDFRGQGRGGRGPRRRKKGEASTVSERTVSEKRVGKLSDPKKVSKGGARMTPVGG